MKRLAIAALLLVGCSRSGEPGRLALVGARVEPSLDAEPIPDAVIVVAAGKIQAIGPRGSTDVPSDAETLDAKGRLIRPMPYNATLEPGAPANLMAFDAATGAPQGVMQDGEWVR